MLTPEAHHKYSLYTLRWEKKMARAAVNDLRSIGSSACVTSSGPTTFVLKTSSMSAAHLLQPGGFEKQRRMRTLGMEAVRVRRQCLRSAFDDQVPEAASFPIGAREP